jgi:putative transcriptional regulator
MILNNEVTTNMSGKMLIATPFTMLGTMFDSSIMYVTQHDKNGAFGFVVSLFSPEYEDKEAMAKLARKMGVEKISLPLNIGGPNDLEKIFILHSDDYTSSNMLHYDPRARLKVSSNLQTLKDYENGTGPRDALLIAGCTIWAPGQLEEEMQNNLWLVTEPMHMLIFDHHEHNKWYFALMLNDINYNHYSPYIGRA